MKLFLVVLIHCQSLRIRGLKQKCIQWCRGHRAEAEHRDTREVAGGSLDVRAQGVPATCPLRPCDEKNQTFEYQETCGSGKR